MSETKLKPVIFTQFLFPDGKRTQVEIDRPEEIFLKANSLRLWGFKFEIENNNDKIWMTIWNPALEKAYDEMCDNGPDVPYTVDRLIRRAFNNYFIGGGANE